MTRGTTPYISFAFDPDEIDITMIDYVEMTINQNGKNVIIKKLALDEEGAFGVQLSEADTLNLKPGQCKIQVKVKLNDNNVLASNIETVSVNDILNGGIML